MSILEYANRTGPDFVKKAVMAGYNSDPVLKSVAAKQLVKRSGGTKVRIPIVVGKHSNTTEITPTNYVVDLSKGPTEDYLEGDWGSYKKPIILLHQDQKRFTDKADMKAWIQGQSRAAVESLKNDVLQQWYVGNTAMRRIASMNGNFATGTSLGFERGALRYETPTAQAAGALSYLGRTRREDTVNNTDNWFNQYKAFTAIGTDALPAIQEVKILADSYAEEGALDMGFLSQRDLVSLDTEIRSSPGGGGQAAVHYTVADIESGKVAKTVTMAAGIMFHANRFMTAANLGVTEAILMMNVVDSLEYWVNANEDFRVGRFVDMLETNGTDADVALIHLEIQIALRNLMVNGACSR